MPVQEKFYRVETARFIASVNEQMIFGSVFQVLERGRGLLLIQETNLTLMPRDLGVCM